MTSPQINIQRNASRLRFQSNTQSHTKSKLINSLINQKLSQQKQQVLTRYMKLAKKASEQKLPEPQSQFQIRKRASSLKNLNVSMEKIRESLTYNSVNVNKQLTEEAQFIISRQYYSPIVGQEQVAELNGLRQKSGLLEVKLMGKDKTGLEYYSLQDNQENSNKGNTKRDWVKELQERIDNQLWLPGSPHVQTLLEDLQDNNKQLKISQPNFDQLPLVKSPVFNDHGNSFKPIVSSLSNSHTKKSSEPILSNTNKTTTISTKLIPVLQIEREQIVYDFKKYHKEDYVALEKWFERNVLIAHKRCASKTKTQQKQTLQSTQSPKFLLNLLYTIHISSMQQLIRLTYIQSFPKALTLQKIFWSLIRLFTTLIQHQHKLNYSQYKTYQQQIKSQRQMYEQRCSKLQIMMIRAQTEAKSTETLRQRLSLAYVTYSRVNSHLYKELEFTAGKLTQLQNSFNFINMRFMRLIQLLGEQNRIKTIVTEFDTVYYLKVGQSDKLQELLRVKTSLQERKKLAKKTAQKELKQQMEAQSKPLSNPKNKDEFQKAIIKKRQEIQAHFSSFHPQEQVFEHRIGDRISNVEHELNKYWLNKQQSLKVKEITHEELLNYTTNDIGTSTIEKFQSADYCSQFPQQKQKTFAQFLKQEIEKERTQHKKEITKQEDLYVSLKELYQESYEKVKMFQIKNKELQAELDNTNRVLQKKQQKISALQAELAIKTSDLMIKTQTIELLLKQKRQLQKFITEQAQSSQQLERKFSIEIQNSQTLVRNNFKMKDQIKTLQEKLKLLEEHLQENLTKQDKIELELNKTESDLNDFKQKYEKLHKNLLKISPSVDSFLDFKRYDRQSIVIASVKKDLEKYFPEYFCKDSDVFLTKG